MHVRLEELGVLHHVLVAGLLAGLTVALVLGLGVLLQHGVLVGSRIYLVVRDRLDGAAGVPLGGLAHEGLHLVSDLGGAAQDYDEPGH